jgi:hypothetical protein
MQEKWPKLGLHFAVWQLGTSGAHWTPFQLRIDLRGK